VPPRWRRGEHGGTEALPKWKRRGRLYPPYTHSLLAADCHGLRFWLSTAVFFHAWHGGSDLFFPIGLKSDDRENLDDL
jgi:hypothetical protein